MTTSPSAGDGASSDSDDPSSLAVRRDRLAERIGFPAHAVLSTVPIGALACSFGFDVASRLLSAPCTEFPRPAFLTAIIGLVAGVIAGLFGLRELLLVPRRTAAFRGGVRHVLLTDAGLALFAVSVALRINIDYCQPTAALPFVLAAAGSVALAAGVVVGARTRSAYALGTSRSSVKAHDTIV